MAKTAQIQDRKRLETLAEFRCSLRQFLQFSEQRAEAVGLHPQQHQLLLQIAGAPEGAETTVSYAAERMGLRHHSVVELSKRCEGAGLIERRHGAQDRRCVELRVTAQGLRVLHSLSEDHERELSDLAPRLMRRLRMIRGSARQRRGEAKGGEGRA